MFGRLMITPQVVEIVFPGLFLASYGQLRRFRDPIRCGNGCLHLPGCRFYRITSEDRRKFAASLALDSEQNTKNSYIIYKVLLMLASVAILVPVIFYVAYCVRMIRLGFDRCNCHHQKSCPLGSERFVAPDGCVGWRHRNGYFDSPDGSESVMAIRIAASPARLIHLQNEHFERQERREMKAKRYSRDASGR